MTQPSVPPVAVVFDCDGTLVDSERVTERGMAAVLAGMGHELDPAFFASLVGGTWPRTRARLVDRYGWGDADVARYRAGMGEVMPQLLDDPSLVFDDVVVVLDGLAAEGVPVAVCTSSGRDHLARVLRLPGLVDRFPVRVAREDTAQHKPSPVPYLTALERLADRVGSPLPAGRTTVVEDSAPGVAAGVAAGCRTVAVARGGVHHDLSAAHLVVDRLTPDVLRHPDRGDGPAP